jgi:hypothetical protein
LFSEEGKKRLSDFPHASRMLMHLARVGEPMRWGLLDTSRQGVAKFLDTFGLELVEHFSPSESDDFFFRKQDGELAGHCQKHFHVVVARVP